MNNFKARFAGISLGTVALLSTLPIHAAEVLPTEFFSKFSEFHSVQLSPNGEHIAVTMPRGDTTGMAVLRTDTLELVTASQLDKDMHIFDVEWVGDDKLVSGVGYQEYQAEQPINYGEIVSFGASGGDLRYLMGYKGRPDTSKIPGTVYLGWSYLNNALEDDPNKVLVSACAWASGELCHWSLYELDTDSGRRKRIIRAPQLGSGSFVTDAQGGIRYFVGETENLVGVRFYTYESNERSWSQVEFNGIQDASPVSYDPDSNRVYLTAVGENGLRCLYRTTFASDEVDEVICHDTVDIHSLDFNAKRTRPIRAHFQNGRFESVNLAPDLEEGSLLEAIAQRFDNALVRTTSWSDDGNLFILYVSSDRNPGAYYLFNRSEKQARYLFSRRQWIDPQQMAERRPIQYEARDGTPIHGYLTVPPGAEQPWPLVVLPHGGPFGIRDGWRWDPDAQFLASRGYAVLQVNFRGSGGYGQSFRDLGIRKWGTEMINDITDGAQWAIESGVTRKDNLCIFGASYGGYSSLMSAVREPDLYQCVVAYAGIYDLRTLNRKSDTGQFSRGRNYIDDYVGDSDDELLKHSPMTYIDALKAPVFIVHGINDARTPYKDAKTLRKALKKRDIPYEWFVRDREGHGFRDVTNRTDFYNALAVFLDKHLATGDSATN